jgi:hypothetical protein
MLKTLAMLLWRMMNKQLQALFEIHRQQILLHSKDATGQWNFPASYLYAIARRIAPIFHTRSANEEDPFGECYEADAAFVESVTKWMDEEWLARRTPTFYEMEGKFGHERRAALLMIVRYCALDDLMDAAFYAALLKNGECPIEALSAARPFDESELSPL